MLLYLIFFLATLFQLWFWLVRYRSLGRRENDPSSQDKYDPTVSIVIAVKNDVHHVLQHIHHWLSQDYPNYHVLIIDDHSEDNLYEGIKSVVDQEDRLSYYAVPESQTGKKQALSYGIQQATGEWILATDADCYPNSGDWITEMIRAGRGKDVVLGYSPTLRTSKSMLSEWVSYEHWYVGLQYLSAALLRQPYMGVGRNMAFRRELFFAVDGYSSHQHITSGDDDLFVQSLTDRSQVAICTSPASWVWTYAPQSWRAYLRQKRRHVTTAPVYSRGDQMRLMLTFVSQLVWYVTLTMLVIQNSSWLIALVLRGIILSIVALEVKGSLGRGDRLGIVLVMDILATFIYTCLSFSFLAPKRDW